MCFAWRVAPALGCTEPVAIALAASAAAGLLPKGEIDAIEVWVDPNIYKNGLAVLIPGTPGLNGLDLAAALGVFGGDPGRGLEVLDSLTEETVAKAGSFRLSPGVTVNILSEHRGLRIQARVGSGGHTAEAVIEKVHNNIVSLSLDGEEITHHALLSGDGDGQKPDRDEFEAWVRSLSLSDLLLLVDDLDREDLAFLQQSVDLNLRLAEYGLKHGPALGIGKAIQRLVRQKLLTKDMVLSARMLTSAASDARMGGVKLPAMSSAGSRQPRAHRGAAHLGSAGIRRMRARDGASGHRVFASGDQLCEGPHREAVGVVRLLYRCGVRGHRRDSLSAGRRFGPYGRRHQEPGGGFGRGDLRRGQGGLLAEVGNRRGSCGAIGPVRPAGG